jgi:hypothetical protein
MPNVDVHPITDKEWPRVKKWIKNKHYIKRMPSRPTIRFPMGVFIDGKLVGTLIYGNTLYPSAGSTMFKDEDGKPVMKNNQAVELLRAFTTDESKEQVDNLGSIAVAKGNAWIRKNGKTKDGKPIRAILSYADPEAGHGGTVYQATNAHYLGPQEPGRVLVIRSNKTGDEHEMHRMSVKQVLGTTKIEKLKEHPKFKGRDVEISWRETEGKHKFLWVMGKDQKERDRLMAQLASPLYSYPKKGEKPRQIPNEAKERAKKRATQTQKQKKGKKEEPQTKRAFIKNILTSKIKNPETGNKILVRSALGYDKDHPAHRTAMGMVNALAKKRGIRLKKSRQFA